MQLDLLDWEPPAPPEVVHRLPMARWGAAIWKPKLDRTIAAVKKQRTDAQREAAWQRSSKSVANVMRKAGATEPEIRIELAQFMAAVRAGVWPSGPAKKGGTG